MLIPTPRFWFLLCLGVLVAGAGAVVNNFEVLTIPYDLGLLALFLVTGLVAKRWEGLTIKRSTDNVLSVRVSNRVSLVVESDRDDPIKIKIRDEIPLGCTADKQEFDLKVQADRPAEVSYWITPQDRGEHKFRGTFVRYLAPLGLCWVQKRLENEEPARVYPNVKAVKQFDLLLQRGHLNLMGVRKARIKGLGQEFDSLRDYNEDDYRFLDWKASARRGKLVVRHYETEKNQAVIVCVDLGRQMLAEVGGVTKLDHVLDASLMLLHAAERQGDQIGLLLFNDEVKKYVPPKRGRTHVASLVDGLFDAQAEPVQSNYLSAFSYLTSRWKRRSLVVVFSDAENEDQAADLVASLGSIRRNHKLLVVRVADPRLREMKSRPIVENRDMYKRAAARWYAGDRRRAESVMTAAHVQSLESEPSELASTLVGAYLRIKELALV